MTMESFCSKLKQISLVIVTVHPSVLPRTAYLTVLKICKLMLTTVAHAKVQVVVEACSAESQGPPITVQEHHQAAALQQALHFIPTPESEFTLRGVATRLGQHMGEQVISLRLVSGQWWWWW